MFKSRLFSCREIPLAIVIQPTFLEYATKRFKAYFRASPIRVI